MRYLSVLIVFLVSASCHEVTPVEETAIIEGPDVARCGYCGGWFIQVKDQRFRASLSSEFDKFNYPVYVRYELDQRPGYKEANWIQVQSIRPR